MTECLVNEIRKARKDHFCVGCWSWAIKRGDRYHFNTTIDRGDGFSHTKLCRSCYRVCLTWPIDDWIGGSFAPYHEELEPEPDEWWKGKR